MDGAAARAAEPARSALHHRLGTLELLDEEGLHLLDGLVAEPRCLPAGTLLQEEGGSCTHTWFLLEGWAATHQTLRDGSRQIINLLVPGDSVGLFAALFPRANSTVELLTDARLARVDAPALVELFRESPSLGAALCWLGGCDERFLEQQVVRVGRLDAGRRIAHLLLELHVRLRLGGASELEACALPVTQAVIADTLGMSHVHANRSCRRLQRLGLVETAGGQLLLRDRQGLADHSGFDPAYLRARGIAPGIAERLWAAGEAADPEPG
ncbi:MAG: Crp/Fnr family transcriptional regulator [Pseudomonadales bacterium]|jgi:CRP-like cAMP-binding protein|nr:Crp/Fnr family transcriptional regulator [Pseudomonadales bacterium]